MKQRTGFVSNSSSCSFIINKNDLDQTQIDVLRTIAEESNSYFLVTAFTDEEDEYNGILSMMDKHNIPYEAI